MRVLLVLRYFYCPSMDIGGAERQALRLAQALQEKGVSVTVAAGLWDWGQPRRETIQGVPVHRHFTAWGMWNIRGLRRFGQYLYLLSLFLYLVRHRAAYDVIHCQSAMFEASVVAVAGRWLHKPTLVRSMASGAWGDFRMVRQDRTIRGTSWMLRQVRRADAVVALNPQVADEMVALGVAKEKIRSIPNGVDVPSGRHGRDYALGNPIVVTFVGRLHPQKDAATLVRACGLLLQERPDLSWRLKLAGTGPLAGYLKRLAEELSISRQVEFLGHVNDVDALLEQSDLFVLPSLSEGISNALLEAMAHGLPCIVTDIPGNNDVIRDGENGVLVQVEDVVGLAQAVLAVVENAAWREKLGEEARQTVETRYSLTAVADQYMRLYESLLDQQSGL